MKRKKILCSICVNQFHFKGIDATEIFFDDGSFSGGQMKKQTKQSIYGFETMRAKIASVHVDGDGKNLRGIKLFRLGIDPTDEMSYLSEDYCTFKNPAYPSRRVDIVLCFSSVILELNLKKIVLATNQILKFS